MTVNETSSSALSGYSICISKLLVHFSTDDIYKNSHYGLKGIFALLFGRFADR